MQGVTAAGLGSFFLFFFLKKKKGARKASFLPYLKLKNKLLQRLCTTRSSAPAARGLLAALCSGSTSWGGRKWLFVACAQPEAATCQRIYNPLFPFFFLFCLLQRCGCDARPPGSFSGRRGAEGRRGRSPAVQCPPCRPRSWECRQERCVCKQ